MSEKTCDVEGCDNEFPQKRDSRLRITKKIENGEVVAWICPECGKSLDKRIEYRNKRIQQLGMRPLWLK